jgi:hypothetical protein
MPNFNKIFSLISTIAMLITYTSLTLSYTSVQAEKLIFNDLNSSSQITKDVLTNKTNRKLSPKIIIDKNGEKKLDLESEVSMNKEQSINFEICQKEESKRRSKRNQNKPTACIKLPALLTDELTDQSYNILYDQIQEGEERISGQDMNANKSIEDFLGVLKVEIIQSSEVSSISSVRSSSILLSSNSINDSIKSSISSVARINGSSQSTSSESNSKISFFNIFDSIKAKAVGNASGRKSEGYRLPYPSGTKISTYRTMNDFATHYNRNALDFGSFTGNFQWFNSDIRQHGKK